MMICERQRFHRLKECFILEDTIDGLSGFRIRIKTQRRILALRGDHVGFFLILGRDSEVSAFPACA